MRNTVELVYLECHCNGGQFEIKIPKYTGFFFVFVFFEKRFFGLLRTLKHSHNVLLKHQINTFYNSYRPKRWDEALEKPPLDYSDFFDEDTGQIPGMLFS